MHSLSWNSLGAEGAAALAPALAANGGLTALDLSSNELKDEGVSAVCEAIQSNKETKLASLNFTYNAIGPVGANSVAAMVSVTGALTSLDLSNNQLCSLDYLGRGTFTTEGITAIADALRVNGALTVTNLLGNRLDAESAKMLAEVAKQKGISLCGIQRDQTTADFHDHDLKPPDAILLASDLSQAGVTGALTKMRYVTPQTKSEFGSDWTHIDIRGASDARLLVHVARVRVLRTCVMQPSVGLLSAFPHAACAPSSHIILPLTLHSLLLFAT